MPGAELVLNERQVTPDQQRADVRLTDEAVDAAFAQRHVRVRSGPTTEHRVEDNRALLLWWVGASARA